MDGGTASFDTKNVWYERGMNTIKPDTGLPPAGIPFQSQSHSNYWYVLAPYTNLNTILLPSGTNFTGQFSLSAPEVFSELSFLVSASWGGVNLNVIVHHQDETSQTNTIRVEDWANSTNYAWIAGGRFDMRTRRFDTVGTDQWRLYVRQISLTNNLSPVTRIEFNRGPMRNGDRVAIFGVSGSKGGDFTPISVSGFNEDIVIEATFTGYSLPNLRASISGVDQIYEVGGLVSAFLVVRNDGNTVSPPAKAGIYLRRTNEPYDTATKLLEIDVPPVEPTGNPHVIPISFNTPPGVGGQFSLSHWIDPVSQIPELTETDNQGSTPISIGPNLANSFALLTNISPWEVVINVQVRNGGAAAGASRAAVYWATVGNDNATNGLKVAEFDVPALGVFPDGTWSYAKNLNVPIPSQITAGSYYLVVRVDSTYQLPEVDESNNFFSVRIQVPDRPARPDLLSDVSRFALLTNINPWEIEFDLLIKNQGAPAAATRAAIYLGPNAGEEATNGFKVAEFDVPALPDGENRSLPWRHALTVKVPVPSEIVPGSHYLVVQMDAADQLPEIHEYNNFYSLRVEIPNRPVSINMISEVIVDEDSGPIRIPFRIEGFNLSTVTAKLSNSPTQLLFNGATFEGNSADRTLAIPLETNLNGNFSAELFVSDGTLEISKGFSVIVRPVNDSFTVEPIEDRIIATETQIAIPLIIEDPDGPPIDLQRTVTSEPNLFRIGGLLFNELNGGLQLVLMTTNLLGTSQVTVTLGDGVTTQERTFSATIALPGLHLNAASDSAEVEVTAASRSSATLETSSDLNAWNSLHSVSEGHGVRLSRPRANAEFFRLVPAD